MHMYTSALNYQKVRIPYSALFSQNLNSWIAIYMYKVSLNTCKFHGHYGGCLLVGVGNFRWMIFVEADVAVKTAKLKFHEILSARR